MADEDNNNDNKKKGDSVKQDDNGKNGGGNKDGGKNNDEENICGKNDFKEKGPELFKVLTAKLAYLKDGQEVSDIKNILDSAVTEYNNKKYSVASIKYDEASGKLIRLLRPRARNLLIIELAYLLIWLLGAYLTYKYPDWAIWKDMIRLGVTAAWFGVLGGITIAIFGIYNHIRVGDFDPRLSFWYVCKPIMGGIFGWFIYGLYAIGFISVQGNGIDKMKDPIFIYLLAFLAGFSERFILRMIDKVMAVITTYDAEETGKKN